MTCSQLKYFDNTSISIWESSWRYKHLQLRANMIFSLSRKDAEHVYAQADVQELRQNKGVKNLNEKLTDQTMQLWNQDNSLAFNKLHFLIFASSDPLLVSLRFDSWLCPRMTHLKGQWLSYLYELQLILILSYWQSVGLFMADKLKLLIETLQSDDTQNCEK